MLQYVSNQWPLPIQKSATENKIYAVDIRSANLVHLFGNFTPPIKRLACLLAQPFKMEKRYHRPTKIFVCSRGDKEDMKALLGTKIGMTQILQEDGVIIPVTLVQAGPCVITQIKTDETDGYSAVQVALGGGKNTSKSVQAHVLKADKKLAPRMIREFRNIELTEEQKIGSSFDVTVFEVGDKVKITGTSKGKGFAGTVKRHNFTTSASSHGGNGMVRRPGSIGSMYPQKVFKGKRMAGRMGAEQVTVRGLDIAFVDVDNNLIGIKGAIPGPKRGLVTVVGV